MTQPASLAMVVAHPWEAAPLIQHFQLRRDPLFTALPLYRSSRVGTSGLDCRLMVSGQGIDRAILATSALAQHISDAERCIWLNIGIAGHQQAELGSLLRVNRILATQRATLYPAPTAASRLPGAACYCVDHIETEYRETGLYDMESWGFFFACQYFACHELCQIIKVVSDRPGHPCQPTRESVRQLIEPHLETITQLAHKLAQHAQQTLPTNQTPPLPAQGHYSHSQQQQWKQLWHAINTLSSAEQRRQIQHELEQHRHSRDQLSVLRAVLTRLQQAWPGPDGSASIGSF